MESNLLDTPESFSAARNPFNNHLHYPTTADGHSVERTLPVQATERPLHCDKIYVGNLPHEVSMLGHLLLYKISLTNVLTRVDLHKAFKKFGQITDIQLPYNTGPGGKPKGYAFVMFNNSEVSRTTLCPCMAHRPFFAMRNILLTRPSCFSCILMLVSPCHSTIRCNSDQGCRTFYMGTVDGYSMGRLS